MRGHRRGVFHCGGEHDGLFARDLPAVRASLPESEVLYVLEGEVEFLVGERTIRASKGSCAYIPKRTLHTFNNVGTSPSRVLAILTPGGLDKFFLEAGEPAAEGSSAPEGEPDVGRIVDIGQKYGLGIPPPGQ